MNKSRVFSIILIIIILGIAGYSAWIYFNDTSNDNISCTIRFDADSDNNVTLKVQASGKNAIIKKSDGTNTNQSYYEEKVDQNGTYTFYVTNNKKENSCSVTINEIVERPTGTISINTTKKVTKATLTLIANDTTNLDSKPYSWDQKNWSKTNTLTVTSNGTYTGYIKDKNGTIGKVTYEVTNIDSVDPTGISLNKNSTTITIGESINLTATVAPSNANSKTITWSSSDEKIVTVNSSGKITGKAIGNAKITVTTKNGKIAECNVTVTNNTQYAEAYFLNVYDQSSIVESLKGTKDEGGYYVGLSVLIKTLDSKYILIDTGANNTAVKNVIYNELKEKQGNSKVTLDYMILTHSHTDHSGNALALLKDSNITTNKVIMKNESKASSIYNKVSTQVGNNKMVKLTGDGQKISVGQYLEIYLFNTKDVYAGKTCHGTGDYYDFTTTVKKAALIDGNYYYFDGSKYPNIELVATKTLVTKNNTVVKGLNNYFYAFKVEGGRDDCNANANSLAIIIKVKTSNGNRYMYIPGDLDNSGYDITPINGIYGNGLQIVFPDPKKMEKSNDKNTGLFTGYLADMNRITSETTSANNIKKVLGNDIKNIMIYQSAHHGQNNALDAINILGLNRSNLYTINPIKYDVGISAFFRYIRSHYYVLSKTKKFYPGDGKRGVYCHINNVGTTSCENY